LRVSVMFGIVRGCGKESSPTSGSLYSNILPEKN
jgi:hypothetical protein